MQQNPSYGDNLGNWYSYFFHVMSAFYLSDFHPMVYFILWEMHVFSHQFPIAWEKAAKLIKWGKLEMIWRAHDTNFLHKLLLTER